MKWLFIGQINKVRMLIKETKQSQRREHRQEVASGGRTDYSVKAFYLDNTLEKKPSDKSYLRTGQRKALFGKEWDFFVGGS